MTIFIASDHRGLTLKNQLIEYLQNKDIRVEDLGPYEYNPQDDYPDFAQKVAKAVLQNPDNFFGILICGSGVGMSIAANRYKNIRAGLGFEVAQAKHARENDHINVLCLASDYFDFQKAAQMVDVFLNTPVKSEEKYLRRIRKLDSY